MIEQCGECRYWDAPDDQVGGSAVCGCTSQRPIVRQHNDLCTDFLPALGAPGPPIEMTEAQAIAAIPILNSYAHNYLGMAPSEIMISGGHKKGGEWMLLVSVFGDGGRVEHGLAADLDAAKEIIDGVKHGG